MKRTAAEAWKWVTAAVLWRNLRKKQKNPEESLTFPG
jgi:hypothetical protein